MEEGRRGRKIIKEGRDGGSKKFQVLGKKEEDRRKGGRKWR